MKNVLLKIIIVIAFVGIFVVGGILIIKNRNIDSMAYNTIKIKIKETDFSGLSKDAVNVKDSYDGDDDPYVITVSAMILNTNNAIDFYLDYLAGIKTISRGEQDLLIEKYLAYSAEIANSEKVLEMYETTYETANVEESARGQVVSIAGSFVQAYLKAYEAGSDFYKSLVEIVDKHAHSGKREYNFKEFGLNMCNALADNCVDIIKENMAKRISEQSNANLDDILNSSCYSDYLNFIVKSNDYTRNKTYMNIEFDAFLVKCKDVDFVKVVTQKSEYTDTLTDEKQTMAEEIIDFIEAKFGVVVG